MAPAAAKQLSQACSAALLAAGVFLPTWQLLRVMPQSDCDICTGLCMRGNPIASGDHKVFYVPGFEYNFVWCLRADLPSGHFLARVSVSRSRMPGMRGHQFQ